MSRNVLKVYLRLPAGKLSKTVVVVTVLPQAARTMILPTALTSKTRTSFALKDTRVRAATKGKVSHVVNATIGTPRLDQRGVELHGDKIQRLINQRQM